MRFNAPTQVFVIISVVLAAIAVLSRLMVIKGVTENAFWLLLAGFIALLIGVIYKRR